MVLTTYSNGKILNACFHAAALGPPGTWYLALYSTAQDVAEGGTECVDANYARQVIAFNAASLSKSTNNGAVTFPALAASFTGLAVGLCDALTSGHCWFFENFGSPIVYPLGAVIKISDATAFVSAT